MKTNLKKTISILLALIMAFSVFGGESISALAAGSELYYYYAAGGEERFQFANYCTVLTEDMTALTGNEYGKWYVTGYVSPKGFAGTPAIEHSLTVTGNVNLLLRDGYAVWVEGGIYVTAGSTLTIYGHNTGKLICVATDNAAGIGGKENAVGGHVVINSGYVEAHGGDGAGIGGGCGKDRGFQSVTINGGVVTATGDGGGAGVGDGEDNTKSGGSVITINGGTVNATGGNLDKNRLSDGGGAGIGGGEDSKHTGASIIINGGIVNAQGGDDSAGIGGGENSSDRRAITINGGTVNATGGDGGITNGGGGAGIGGGQDGGSGVIRINGGTIVAKAGGLDETSDEHGAGIGGGANGEGNDVFISGGTVYAQAGSWADGIGGGKCTEETAPWRPVVTIPKPGNTYISGGVVTATTTPDPTETENGAGIGCWAGKTDGGEVVISGGVVFANSTGLGAGIGGGRTMGCSGGTIRISDAYVVATSVDGAGIGSQGSWSDNHVRAGETVEITNSYVFAASTRKGAGIGGGNDGDGCPVVIKDSVVEAIGGNVDYDWYAEHGAVSARGSVFKLEMGKTGYEVGSAVTGMVMSAVLTLLNQLVYSGDYRGAGIGGGDEGKGGDVTIENSSVLAVGGGDKAHAFGHGHDTDGSNGTLTLADDMMVLAGASEDSLSAVDKNARISSAWNSYYVKTEPCTHDGAAYAGAPDGHCVEACPHCALTADKNDLAPHTFGADKHCIVCGYQGVQVTFRSGSFAGSAEPVVTGKGAQLTLPGALFTECEDQGYMQTGWLCGDAEYSFGDAITVNDDITVTALYEMYNDVLIVDSDFGSAAADRAYAVPGSVVTVTATPDTGYRLSGVRIRANGETVYEKNETGAEGLALTHSFTMPQSGNVSVYTTFNKNGYSVRTDVDTFDTEIEVEVNGKPASAASYGDEITVRLLPRDDVQGVLWVETDADGNETGQRHCLPLGADSSASFTLEVLSDVLIKPNRAHEHDGVAFQPWGDEAAEQTSLPSSGNYYLTHDVVLPVSFNPNVGEYHLCLNGHSITISDDFADAAVFDIYARHIFIHDHDDSGVIDVRGKCRLFNLTNSRLFLYGGTLTGGSASTGSVVNVSTTNDYEKYCGFTMSGGVVTGNSGSSQGIIYTGFAKTTITGGEITGNVAPAAFTVQKTGVFEISGSPRIYGNHRAGSPDGANVLVSSDASVGIAGKLSEKAIIGITANGVPTAAKPLVVTNGLSGNGELKNFFSDEGDLRIADVCDGEIAIALPVTVSFDANGAAGAPMPEDIAGAGCDYTLPPHSYIPPAGTEFLGWRADDAETILQPDAVVSPRADVTMHAVWNEASGGDVVIPEAHVHRWEIRLDDGDQAKATVRCVNTTIGGDALCNETELKTVELQTDGRSGAEYERAYNGKAAVTVARKQKAYVWTTAFPEEDLISVSGVSYYDETGALLSGAPTEAGVYTARSTVSPVNGRGDAVTMSKTIRIVKAPAPDVTVRGLENLPLTNELQPLVEVSDASADGKMHYRVNGGKWTYRLPEASESGEYTIEWYFDCPNYEGIHSEQAPGVVNASISELHEHNGVRFTRWTETDSLPTSGSYYLANDVVWSKGPWTITGELNLCLFGHTVRFDRRWTDPDTGVFVYNGGTLNLYGDGAGKLLASSGVEFNVSSGGTLNCYDACLDSFGGGIHVYGVFGMNGGMVVGSSVGVDVKNGAFNMNGGVIKNNGFGIKTSAGGSINVSGGAEIRDNATFGVSVVRDCSFNVSGGPQIKDNGTYNVYLQNNARINVTGALRGADIGVTPENDPYGSPIVFTSGYNDHNDGVHPSGFFSIDNVSDDRIFVGKSDDGEAYAGVHSHHFIVEPAFGGTDAAYAYCDAEGCPIGDSATLTFSIAAEDAVYDGKGHQAVLTKPEWKFEGLNVSSVQYKKDGEDFTELYPSKTGEYTAFAVITGAEGSVTIETSFTIEKKQASVDVVAGKDLVYDGGQSTIATFEGVEGGYIRYAVDSNAPESFTEYLYLTDLPPYQPFGKAIEVGRAGWHTVYYFVVNDGNHLPLGSIEEPVELKVLIKATVTMFGKTDDESIAITVDPSSFTAPECPFEAPEGKVFGYWKVNYKDIGRQLNVGEPYSFTVDIKLYPVWVDPHEHAYGAPEWTWAEDFSSATAKFSCTGCGDVQIVDAAITAETTDATHSAAGKTVYAATAPFAGETFTDTKEAEIPQIAHTPGEKVTENEITADCHKEGSYDEVVYCTACGDEISRQTIHTPAVSHVEGETVIENKVEATYEQEGGYDEVVYCANCGDELTRRHVTLEKLTPDPTEPTDPTDPTGPTDSPDTEKGPCKYCGRDHSGGIIQRIIGFFHTILYFFARLFGRM